jgi:Domain of unknown function (DUF4908)
MSEPNATILSKPGAAAFAALMALSASPALAQPRQQQQQPQDQQTQAVSPVIGLFANKNGQAARYSTPDGALRFIFDRTYGRVALVRFEGDPEVHALRPRMGPNGDEIYTTDDGAVRLRFTPHGGISVYTRTLRTGAAASEVERVDPLTPVEVAFARFQARLRQLQAEAQRRLGRQVTFEAPMQTNQPVSGVMLDAAERAAQGLADAPLTTVRRVIIVVGPTPGASLRGEALTIQVTPQLGYAGRPSSAAIRDVATGTPQGPDR